MDTDKSRAENGKNSRFSADRQPEKRGRRRSIFGPLEKESDLSLDDIRKVYKNILTAKSFDKLEEIKSKHPTVLTEMTIDMLRQDRLGRLTGRKITVMGKNRKTGEDEERVIDERVRSYETIQYMLDRIYGTPTKVDLSVSGDMSVKISPPPELEDWYPED